MPWSRLKLGDFGLSGICLNGEHLTEVYGTAPFMAPEMLREGKYDEKIDVWSTWQLLYHNLTDPLQFPPP
eukprot:210637-Amphidinium_carterae.2